MLGLFHVGKPTALSAPVTREEAVWMTEAP